MGTRSAQGRGEIWMILRDRKKLLTLIVVQELTHRQLARGAGLRSHAYLGRLLRGEVDTLKVEPAVRMCKFLGVPVDDLFLTKVSNPSARSAKGNRTAA